MNRAYVLNCINSFTNAVTDNQISRVAQNVFQHLLYHS